jgi:hypothetical protein
MEIILYVLAVMIFWDFSTHVVELLGWQDKFKNSKSLWSYYYPHLRYKKGPSGPVERENGYLVYQRFWVTFWGTAFLLILIYIVFH